MCRLFACGRPRVLSETRPACCFSLPALVVASASHRAAALLATAAIAVAARALRRRGWRWRRRACGRRAWRCRRRRKASLGEAGARVLVAAPTATSGAALGVGAAPGIRWKAVARGAEGGRRRWILGALRHGLGRRSWRRRRRDLERPQHDVGRSTVCENAGHGTGEQRSPCFSRREAGVPGPDQRENAADVRAGHRGARHDGGASVRGTADRPDA